MDPVDRIAEAARAHQLFVAVAESLTSGAVASRLGAGPGAAKWFRGGVVAYGEPVKFRVLGVTPGPVVTERCAAEMASGVARVLDADVAVAVTGVGGPGPHEGRPPGTVIVAVTGPGGRQCRSFLFQGDPEDIVSAARDAAVTMLADTLTEHVGS
jgi:nicotinamide-nucleotide amidase